MRDSRLDCLRAVAVVLVFGAHWETVTLWHRSGWMGVELFFVLSGYLISGLLFREFQQYGAIKVGRFYVRRGLKIYPAFYTMLALTFAMWFRHGNRPPLTNVAAELFFFQNYHKGLWLHTWSLAVEEHFYFALPLILLLMTAAWGSQPRAQHAADPFRWVPLLSGVAAVGCLAMRAFAARDAVNHEFLFQSHLQIDSLLFGVLLSYLRHFRPAALEKFERLPLWLIGAALVAPVALSNPLSYFVRTIGLTMSYVGFGCILLAALQWRVPERGLMKRVVAAAAAVGVYSYSIYLWHVAVAIVLPKILGKVHIAPQHALGTLIYVATAIVTGIVMAKIVEVPVLAARDRWFPSRSAAIAKVAAAG